MRIIDADALIAKLEADAEEMEEPIAKMFTYAAINDVEHAPTVDAVPVKHGHWIGLQHDGEYGYSVQTSMCSVCGQDVIRYVAYDDAPATVEINYDYCPNCGAKMDGRDGEADGRTD